MNAGQDLLTHIPTLLSLWRGNKNAFPLSKRELSEVSAALLSLQRGLTGNRNLAGAGYMENGSLLGAYLLYYWPVSYMQVSYAAEFCTRSFPADKTVTILDVGCGPAPASIAICDRLAESGISVAQVTLADSSSKALNLAQKIYGRDVQGVSVKTVQADLQRGLPVLDAEYDIIVMSHCLNELWKNRDDRMEARSRFLLELAGHLAPGGMLLVLEPALLETSRNLIQLRDVLVQRGLFVAAPCLKSVTCPINHTGTGQTCHAEIQWQPCEPVASIARNARLDRESVKMTYFVFSKTAPIQVNDGIYRVVSDGMLNKSGRIRYLLCDGEKRIPLSAKNGDSHAGQTGFFNLSRYDSVRVLNPQMRGEGDSPAMGICEETELEITPFADG